MVSRWLDSTLLAAPYERGSHYAKQKSHVQGFLFIWRSIARRGWLDDLMAVMQNPPEPPAH